jgi:hypothetical protein
MESELKGISETIASFTPYLLDIYPVFTMGLVSEE